MAYLSVPKIVESISASGKGVFTLNDIAKLTGKNKRYLSRLMSTSENVGHLERNKYYVKGSDIYALASNIVYPSYISLLSAFRYHNITTQVPVRFAVITTKRHAEIVLEGVKIDFITFGRERVFGYERINGAFVAAIEKSIVDALYLSDPPYAYVEEAFKKAVEKIDLQKLKEYGIYMKSKTLISRLGFLLDSSGENADDLLEYRSEKRIFISKNGTLNRKWGIYA